MFDLLVALMILSPVCPSISLPPAFLPALQRVALTLDLVGANEVWRTDLRAELLWCRCAWRDLRYCPPSCAAVYLPPHQECRELFAGNLAFRYQLRLRRQVELHRTGDLALWAEEALRIGRFWESARDATNPDYGLRARRLALREGLEYLRVNGLPPAIPYSHTTP